MRFDVNETILRHIATAGGAAFALRQAADRDLSELIAGLFGARSDIRRLDRAQLVARTILRINDFSDMMELRDIVARQELQRLINYSKQKDHTAHTVYLYLLGIWFFDNVSDIHSAVVTQSGAQTEEDACDWFLYQWLFASLLHDIGYAFYDLSSDTREDRERIDEAYSWKWLNHLLGPSQGLGRTLSDKTFAKLRAIHDAITLKYLKKMPPPTAKYAPGAQAEILQRLAAAPWLGDLCADWRDKDIFDVLTLGPDADLRTYAMAVAAHGYVPNGTGGCVDHAVASGLLLFQYTSYWYWLLNELRPDTAAYEEATAGFSYDLSELHKALEACRAVAYHNVQPSVSGAQAILQGITLAEHPVLYLSIVCDELQSWDRYPAGDAVLRQFQQTAASSLEGEDIELTCAGTGIRTARFRVGHSKQADIVNSLRETLKRKLPDYERVVVVTDEP